MPSSAASLWSMIWKPAWTRGQGIATPVVVTREESQSPPPADHRWAGGEERGQFAGAPGRAEGAGRLAATLDSLEAALAERGETVETHQREAAALGQRKSTLQSEIDRRRFRQEELQRICSAPTRTPSGLPLPPAGGDGIGERREVEEAVAASNGRGLSGRHRVRQLGAGGGDRAARGSWMNGRPACAWSGRRRTPGSRSPGWRRRRVRPARMSGGSPSATSVERQLREAGPGRRARRGAWTLARQKAEGGGGGAPGRQAGRAARGGRDRRGERAGHADQLEGASMPTCAPSERASAASSGAPRRGRAHRL